MPVHRSKIPTVVTSSGEVKVQERHTMPKLNLDASQFTKPDGSTDHEALGRILTRMQDSYTDGTQAVRSHPLSKMCVLEKVALVPGQTYTLKHTLGEPFARYNPLRSYALPGKGVQSVGVTAGGSGYPSQVTVSISPPDMPNGVQATATATVSGGAIASINVTLSGYGYSRAPTVQIQSSGGSGASFSVNLGTVYSNTFSVSEIDEKSWPSGVTADQYLVVYSNCMGVYDIGIYGG